jgi:hypothetical protein
LLKDWKYGSSSRACLAQGPEFKLQYQEKERERERERDKESSHAEIIWVRFWR